LIFGEFITFFLWILIQELSRKNYNLWSDLSTLVSNFSMGGGLTLQNIEIMVRSHFINLKSNLSFEHNSSTHPFFLNANPLECYDFQDLSNSLKKA
jgi:hypothetical protein